MVMLLPFCPADRHRLLPCHHLLPAALFPQSWLLPWKASTFVLSLPDSFSFGSWPLCQGLARKSLLFCVLQRWKWQSRSDRFSIALCSAVLLSFRELPLVEMELQVNLSDFVLAFAPQISSFLSYCLTLCLCLPATEIEQTVFVFTFSACSKHRMMRRFQSAACSSISSFPPSFEDQHQMVELCACISALPCATGFVTI